MRFVRLCGTGNAKVMFRIMEFAARIRHVDMCLAGARWHPV
jgi:hypothetical protein